MKNLLGLGMIAGALVHGQPPLPGPLSPLAWNLGPEVSIEMTLVKGAPFSGEFVTETLQQLPDGNRITAKRSEVYVRDAEGRTRREMGPVTLSTIPLPRSI